MPKTNLKKFLERIKKDRCNRCKGCGFKSKKGPALVPPPGKIVGIVISQDPTVTWAHFYEYSMNERQEDIHRKMLFTSAIPLRLINRILEFRKRIPQDTKRHLFDVIFEKTYWTHLHKCFTDPGKESQKYKVSNAMSCADRWLNEELGYAIGNKSEFIIALGKDAKDWFKDEGRENRWKDKVQIIYMPHPSGRNRKWNKKNDNEEEIKKAIGDLLRLCGRVT